jgi:signal transduction histidine kinase
MDRITRHTPTKSPPSAGFLIPFRSLWGAIGSHAPWVVTVGILLLFGVFVLLARYQLGARLHEQIAGRDAEVLYQVWQSQEDLGVVGDALISRTSGPEDQLSKILEASSLRQMKGLKATRLYDGVGTLIITFPLLVSDGTLSAEELQALRTLRPLNRFHPAFDPARLLAADTTIVSDRREPVHEVLLPLHVPGDHRLLGVAQFLLDGESLAREFAALDRTLTFQAWGVFLAMGSLLVALLSWAFWRLQQANLALAERTQGLLRANHELMIAAKTSAVGAVAAHLIHGLKNPLASLQSMMSGRLTVDSFGGRDGAFPGAEEDAGPVDWDLAASTARRMEGLISDTVRVLSEHDGVSEYEITVDELLGLIKSRLAPELESTGVLLNARRTHESVLRNREANLVLLILENLLHNAVVRFTWTSARNLGTWFLKSKMRAPAFRIICGRVSFSRVNRRKRVAQVWAWPLVTNWRDPWGLIYDWRLPVRSAVSSSCDFPKTCPSRPRACRR